MHVSDTMPFDAVQIVALGAYSIATAAVFKRVDGETMRYNNLYGVLCVALVWF